MEKSKKAEKLANEYNIPIEIFDIECSEEMAMLYEDMFGTI